MATKSQQKREQKKAQRKKRLTKERNLRVNGARFRFTLECRLSKKDKWKAMKRFRNGDEVNKHLEETKAVRLRGDTDIIEGRVVDHNQLNRIVAQVKPYIAEKGITMQQAAKDSLSKINTENVKEAVEKTDLAAVSKYKQPATKEAADAEDCVVKPDDLP